MFDNKNYNEIVEITNADVFSQELNIIKENFDVNSSICILPQRIDENNIRAFASESSNFKKYCKINGELINQFKTDFDVSLALHSNEIWLPIVVAFSAVLLDKAIDLLVSFIKFRIGKGRKKENIVHIRITDGDKTLSFDGDAEVFEKKFTKTNINNFFSDKNNKGGG